MDPGPHHPTGDARPNMVAHRNGLDTALSATPPTTTGTAHAAVPLPAGTTAAPTHLLSHQFTYFSTSFLLVLFIHGIYCTLVPSRSRSISSLLCALRFRSLRSFLLHLLPVLCVYRGCRTPACTEPFKESLLFQPIRSLPFPRSYGSISLWQHNRRYEHPFDHQPRFSIPFQCVINTEPSTDLFILG